MSLGLDIVVITSYGHFDYTARAIASCLETSGPQTRILIVDDASPGWRWGEGPLAPYMRGEEGNVNFGGARVLVLHFEVNGGLTRSWNQGLRVAFDLGAEHVALANNDVLFTKGWELALKHHLAHGFDLVGPVSNAPGITAGGMQEAKRWHKGFRVCDDREYLDSVAVGLHEQHFNTAVEASVNGFFLMARTGQWWANAYDAVARLVFRPSNDFTSEGKRNPTPLMTLNEDEYQGRLHRRGGRSAVCPGSFIFHYRSVTRGDRYKRPGWLRRSEGAGA